MEAIPFEQTQQDVAELKQRFNDLFEFLKRKTEPQTEPQTELPIEIKEVSILIKKSVPTIYGYVHRNEIPHCKKGNRLYFFKSDIIEWLKDGKQKINNDLELEVESYLTSKK